MKKPSKDKQLYFFSTLLNYRINRFKKVNELTINSILVHRWDEIGDLVCSLHVFDLLHHRFPNVKLDVVAKFPAADLLLSHPAINEVYTSLDALKGKSRYDLMVDLRESEASIRFARKNSPKFRLARGPIRFDAKRKKLAHEHEVVTNNLIVQPLFEEQLALPELRIFTSPNNISNARIFIQRNVINNFAIMHTGAGKLLRRWSLDKFALLADYLKKEHQLDIVFTGDSNDLTDINKIKAKLDFQTFEFIGVGSLRDFAALCQTATVFVGNESGPMHIAAASQIPTIGLFGPGEPPIFSPHGKKARFIHHKLECNPCDQVHCVYPENPCMNRISVSEVKKVIEELLLESK